MMSGSTFYYANYQSTITGQIGHWNLVIHWSLRHWPLFISTSSSCNGRNDADFIAVVELGLLVLEETNVLLIHVDINEAADRASVVQQPFLEPRKAGL